MNKPMDATARENGSLTGLGPIVAASAKAFASALLVVLVAFTWQQLDDLKEKQELSAAWADAQDYAVFYPHSIGNDRVEIEGGGHSTAIAEARDLYPVIDDAGGIFIEAFNYEPWVPADDPSSPWPAPPIQVNTNYLEQYPILDESGIPIRVDPTEKDWVVAVPEQYKSREAEFRDFIRATRIGGPEFEGAVQAQERMLGLAVPEQFVEQEVRIVWMASEQEIFSFNSTVNPDAGHMIVDPVVQIMTSANSLVVDRLNSFNGDMNSPMKVRVDGDPAAVLAELTPTLQQLNLDDNLRHLVTAHEAILGEVGEIRTGIAWLSAIGAAVLLVMCLLSTSLVSITSNRLRRELIVRRLHGFGFIRTYRELLTLLAVTWSGQAVLAGLMLSVLSSGGQQMPDPNPTTAPEISLLPPAIAVLLVFEILLVVVVAGIIERRNAVKRLKEL